MTQYLATKCDMQELRSVVDAIDRMTAKLDTLPKLQDSISFEDVAAAVFVALIGAFSAYCFNHMHWKMVNRNNNISRFSKELNVLINQLEDESVQYWVKGYDDKFEYELAAAEVSIKSKIRVINTIIDLFVQTINQADYGLQITKLKLFKKDIFDLVTGGDFESKIRTASKNRAIKISMSCSDIRATIVQLDLNS